MSADFRPELGAYKSLKPFVFWAQATLPTVFDDSLSYYESVSKLAKMINTLLENVDTSEENIERLAQAYDELQGYVNTYFDNLDVQNEINNKLDSLAQDGTLSGLIEPFLPDIVASQLGDVVEGQIGGVVADQIDDVVEEQLPEQFTLGANGSERLSEWLDENITQPTNPVIDPTLSIEGAAADAKATGIRINEQFSSLSDRIWRLSAVNLSNGTDHTVLNPTTGEVTTDPESNFSTIEFSVMGGSAETIVIQATDMDEWGETGYAFFDKNGDYISGANYPSENTYVLLLAPANAYSAKASYVKTQFAINPLIAVADNFNTIIDYINSVKETIPTPVIIDPTLSVEGEAADAKATGELKSALTQIVPIKDEIAFTSGGYIKTNKSAGESVSLTPTADPTWSYAIVSCTVGDVFELNIEGANAARAWSFLTSEDEMIEKSNAGVVNGKITAPTNAAKLVMNNKMANGHAYAVDGTDAFAELQEDVEVLEAIVTPTLAKEVVNLKSWYVPVERYENIVYDQKLFTNETLVNGSGENAARVLEKDKSVRFQNNPYSIHFKTSVTGAYTDFRMTFGTSFTLLGTQEFEVMLYISDATNISRISLRTPLNESGMSAEVDVAPQTGWNRIRFYTMGSGGDETITTTSLRILTYHTVGTDIDIYVGSVTQVKPDKGNLIIIDDAGYYSFYTDAYPDLMALNVPVTWGLVFALGSATDNPRHLITPAELEDIKNDGLSEFSFRSTNGTIDFQGDTTPEPALADTLKCIRLLQYYNVMPQRIFRAVWPFNKSPHPELANLEMDASVSYNGDAGDDAFPWKNKYNIYRNGLSNRDTDWVDSHFNALRKWHCTTLIYLHGIGDGSGNTSTSLWSYFVGKLQEGLNAGWLNATTYNRLVSHYRKIK